MMTQKNKSGELRKQARDLRNEYKDTFGLLNYNARQKAGFVRRVKNHARKLDPQNVADTDNVDAIMYLDQLALWLDIDLELGGDHV